MLKYVEILIGPDTINTVPVVILVSINSMVMYAT